MSVKKNLILKAIKNRFVKEYGFESIEYAENEHGENYIDNPNEIMLESSISDDRYIFVMEGNELIIYGSCLQRIGEYEIGDPNSFDMDKIEKLVLTELVEKYKFDKKKIELRRHYYDNQIKCLQRLLERVKHESKTST